MTYTIYRLTGPSAPTTITSRATGATNREALTTVASSGRGLYPQGETYLVVPNVDTNLAGSASQYIDGGLLFRWGCPQPEPEAMPVTL